MEASESDSTPGPSGMEEDTVTPFVSESERGDLLSSEDSETGTGANFLRVKQTRGR